MELRKNDIIETHIEAVSSEGNGICRAENGEVIFVPNSAVGDTLKVRIVKKLKKYSFGKIEELISPSLDRIETDCPCFYQCGGCVYRHISYDAELKIKEQRVRDAVERIGKITDVKVDKIVGSELEERYRNKAQYPVGKNQSGEIISGFYGLHSHRIVSCDDCLLQPEIFSQINKTVLDFMKSSKNDVYDETTHKGKLRHIYLRQGEKTGEIMVCLVVNGNGLKDEPTLVKELTEKFPQIKSIVVNSNRDKTNVILGKRNRVVFGQEYITDQLLGVSFRISPHSFYQVNRRQAEKLYSIAAEYADLSKEDVLLDLYCGTGTIGLTMANKVKELVGVEIVEDAIKDAKINAQINNVENSRFLCGDASYAADELKKEGVRPDVVIVDPPRKGCDEKLLNTIKEMSPKRIVYVSCDPGTLARDLAILKTLGYPPQKITPVDMFPRTAHVETVVLLGRELEKSREHVYLDYEPSKEIDLPGGATYSEIKQWIQAEYGLKVSSLYVAQVKQKHGIVERECYNKPKSENAKQPKCPPEKEAAIEAALKHFKMI